MSDDELLQRELRRIKAAVKENFRRVKTIQNRQLAQKGRENSIQAKFQVEKDGEAANALEAISSATNIIFREAQHLVHYLDYIFPIQYAFYVDAPDQGGRGWLLFLLERSKRTFLSHDPAFLT
jgi:hypothetical protein